MRVRHVRDHRVHHRARAEQLRALPEAAPEAQALRFATFRSLAQYHSRTLKQQQQGAEGGKLDFAEQCLRTALAAGRLGGADRLELAFFQQVWASAVRPAPLRAG